MDVSPIDRPLAEDRTAATPIELPGAVVRLAALVAVGVTTLVAAAWLFATTAPGVVLALAAVATLPVVLSALAVWVVTGAF